MDQLHWLAVAAGGGRMQPAKSDTRAAALMPVRMLSPQSPGCSPSRRPVCWASSRMRSHSCSVGAAAAAVLLAIRAGLELTQLALQVTTPTLVARRPARSGAAAGPARLPRAAAAPPRHVGVCSQGEPARSSCRKCVTRLWPLLNLWSVFTPHLHCACPATMQRMRTNAFMCSSPMLQHSVWRRRITWVLRVVGHVRLHNTCCRGHVRLCSDAAHEDAAIRCGMCLCRLLPLARVGMQTHTDYCLPHPGCSCRCWRQSLQR